MSFQPESSSSLPAGAAAASSKAALDAEHGAQAQNAHIQSEGPSPVDVPRPIGPDRLRALREAIEAGTYPSRDDVVGGLERLFERS